jgi:CRP/FNR family transcriptional regulator, cyclic AMP receptor protein
VDTALAELIPSDQRGQARQATGAATIEFDVGNWTSPVDSEQIRGGYGLLVFEGLLLRRAGIEGRHAAELLGPGDLLRPWQHDGGDSTLSVDWAFRVVAPARVAVLDPRWTARAAVWPQLGAELAGRALMRSVRLVIAMAIAQQPRLDERLWMLFWDLADRFGKVHADGVHLDLPLTHEVLSHLAGARRPSVSGALTRLADEGRLRRAGRHWVLAGDPPPLDHSLATNGARSQNGR